MAVAFLVEPGADLVDQVRRDAASLRRRVEADPVEPVPERLGDRLYGIRLDTPSERGRVTADLPAPDANGRIQYAGALPLQSFAAGSYRLKVTALTGTTSDSRQAAFTVTE